MDDSRVIHRCNLAESGRWICRVHSGSERAVQGEVVAVIEYIECLRDSFHPRALCNSERAAQPRTQAEEIVSDSSVAVDEYPVHRGARRGALERGGSGSDIERQGRVVLQHATQLKAVTDALPSAVRRRRR